MRRRFAHVFVALMLVPAAGAAQDTERARLLFEQGVRAMDSGNPGSASQYFQQSYQLYPRASTACNMATSLERTGRGCEAEGWYRQCAALDQEGRFRDHANRQAAALGAQCNQAPAQSPFVGDGRPSAPATQATAQPGHVQVVQQETVYRPMRPPPSHVMLGVGIPALVLGAGAIVGGGFAAGEASYQASFLPLDRPILIEGSPEADVYYDAQAYSNLALGLYVAGSVIGGLGVVLIIADLAQPGVFGDRADASDGPRLALRSLPGGGALADLRLRF